MAKILFTRSSVETYNVRGLDDIVKNQAPLVKNTMDNYGEGDKTFTNDTFIVELEDTTLNASGSHRIGVGVQDIDADNVGDALAELLSAIQDAILGQIPNGTITEEKLDSSLVAKINGWIRPVTDNQVKIDELYVNEGIQSIIGPDGETYYDYPKSSKAFTSGTIDMGFVFAATINQGTDTIEISSLIKAKDGSTPSVLSDCFKVGEEITLANDTQRELFKITNIDDGTATLTLNANITLTYAAGANVYRSNLTVNGDVWEFGGFSSQETINKTTPQQIVNSPYSTAGNGGRKALRLDNGAWISALNDTGTALSIVKSTDNGDNWTEIYNLAVTSIDDWCIETDGTYIYLLLQFTVGQIRVLQDDGTLLDTDNLFSFNDASGCSLAINEFGGRNKITAAMSIKDGTYPNSFNIQAVQGTISSGVVTWGSVEQLSTLNFSGQDNKNPTVIYRNDNNPVIVCDFNNSTVNNSLRNFRYNGSSWDTNSFASNNGYTQSNPSATFMPPSVATKRNASYTSGLSIVAWVGTDSTDTNRPNVRCIASSDGGLTWFDFGVTNEKVTSGNSYTQDAPSPCWNNDGDLWIVWFGTTADSSGQNEIQSIENNVSTGYGSVIVIGTDVGGRDHPSTVNNFHDFKNPLTVYRDNGNLDVKFYGKWTVGSLTPVTEIDVRINIEAREDKKQITAFLETNDFDTVTLDGFLSIRQSGNEEAYVETTDTKVDEGTNNMYMSVGDVATGAKLSTMKYNLTRANTSDNVQIKRVQGGIAA